MYVDDIIITCSNAQLIQQVIDNLESTFALKDLSELNYFLGIQGTKNQLGLHISKSKYVADLLSKTGLEDCTPCSTPMAFRVFLTKTDNDHFLIFLCIEALLGHYNMSL